MHDVNGRSPRILNRDVARIVCGLWPVTLTELQSRGRTKRVAEARQVAFWLGVRCGGQSRAAVGRFYDRDHTSVMHGLRAVEARRAGDVEFARRLALAVACVAVLRPRHGPDYAIGWAMPVAAAARFQTLEVLG